MVAQVIRGETTANIFDGEMAESSLSNIYICLEGARPPIVHIIYGHAHPTDESTNEKPAKYEEHTNTADVKEWVSACQPTALFLPELGLLWQLGDVGLRLLGRGLSHP